MTAEKVRVLHVHDVASVAENLVSGLCEIGVDAKLYTLQPKNPKLPRPLQPLNTLYLRFSEIFRLRQYLKKEKFDIVHVHFGSFAYLALFNRNPFFLHIHGTDIRSFVDWPILGNVIREGIRKAEAVFYSTPDLKPLIERFRSDAIFFPNPIDTSLFKPSVETKQKADPIIFNINKIDRYKGTEMVLKALELVWKQFPNLTVMMFSFGNALEEAAQFLSKYQDDPRLVLLPRIPHDEMSKYIQSASVVMGQLGTGILTVSELEAMASAKPVVCNFSYAHMYPTPPPVIIANTPEEACEQMLYLIHHPEVAQATGEKARNWVVENFDKRRVAAKLYEIYGNHRGRNKTLA